MTMGLYRSRSERMLGGVLGGIAKHLGWSATRVRVAYVLLSILSAAFPGIAVYIVLWIVVPEEPMTVRP
jgi:phage shock protein C